MREHIIALDIDIQQKGANAYRVSLNGSPDTITSPDLEAQLDQAFSGHVAMAVFDMEHLTFISSAGLRVIFKTLKKLKASDGRVGVSKMSPSVRKVFEIVKALPDMNVFANDEEMDAYLAAMQRPDT